MPQRDLYLIAYDISSDRLRGKALRAVRAYATGGQKSVHECWLTPREHTALLERLEAVVEVDDRYLSLRLDPRQEVLALGRGVVPEDPDWFYLG